MDIFRLTKSKTRKKVLQLFFSNPEKRYYLRELERILLISAGNLRRELLSLGESGIFKRKKQGKEIYYYLNKNLPYYPELKSIVFKTIGIEAELRNTLKKIKGIVQAFIFGSYAKGIEKPASDIDLMIVGKVDENELIKEVSLLEARLKREINYYLIDKKEWRKKSATDSFVKEVITGPKIRII